MDDNDRPGAGCLIGLVGCVPIWAGLYWLVTHGYGLVVAIILVAIAGGLACLVPELMRASELYLLDDE